MSWLRNAWQVAASGAELADGLLARRICSEEILLFRTASGRAVAFQDRCPHRLVPLSFGRKVGDTVQCAYHGLCFGADGQCTHIPGQDLIPPAARVLTYPVQERFGFVWIWLGQADLADPALVPELRWMDLAGWSPVVGYLRFDSNYRLITDNLLDLSHESYLHNTTIGNAEEQPIAEFPVKVTREQNRLVRAHRDMPGISPPPFFAKILKLNGSTETINRWQSAVYMPPGIHVTDVGAYRVSTPRSEASMWRVFHLLTPETETSTHYFWAFSRNFSLDDTGLSEAVMAGTYSTFEEDRSMLEKQQETLTRFPELNVPNVAIRVDAAPMQSRRMLQEFIEKETADPRSVARPVSLGVDTSPLSTGLPG